MFLPHTIIPNISHLSIPLLKQHNIKVLVFDKDNTLTKPYSFDIHQEFLDTWTLLKKEFQIVVVSNSAGSHDDPGYKKATKIEQEWGVQVYKSSVKKPNGHEQLLQQLGVDRKHVAMIGDRILTDVLFGRRMGCFTVWCSREITTTGDNVFAMIIRKMEQLGMQMYLRVGAKLPKF